MAISVAILGATGVVGQKAIALLARNPNFKIIELVASDKRVGQIFTQACKWREQLALPENIASMKLVDARNLKAEFVVSCLPAEVAQTIEPMLAAQGRLVFSNASAFRMTADVPLLIPEVNSNHLALLSKQKTPGKIITNPNCSAVGVALALAPLQTISAIQHVSVVTLQSISGAGYPGVAALDILGNTIPHIQGEAEKITAETKKILGSINSPAAFAITTHVHRVPVTYGHTITLHITFKDDIQPIKAQQAYEEWNKRYSGLFVLHTQDDKPQSTKDLLPDDMRVHLGNLRQGDQKNIIGLISLTHNLVRGAAGAVIANMQSYLDHN